MYNGIGYNDNFIYILVWLYNLDCVMILWLFKKVGFWYIFEIFFESLIYLYG